MPAKTTRKQPGRGLRDRRGDALRITVGFDSDTFEQIRDRAVKAETSFAEQVRLLVEWGLEAGDS